MTPRIDPTIPSRGTRAICSGCRNERRIMSRGLCDGCYGDPKLRKFAPCKKKWRKWTPEETEALVKLRRQKKTIKETAKALNRTVVEVWNKSRIMGLRHKLGPHKGSGKRKGYAKHKCWICDARMPKGGTGDGWRVLWSGSKKKHECYCPSCYPAGGFPKRPNHPNRPVFVGVSGPAIYRTPEVA
jgi:hypothetical protein